MAAYRFYLGTNYTGYTVEPGGWKRITFPKVDITTPFSYIKVEIWFWDLGDPPFTFGASLDDLSLTVSLTGIAPSSFGRVKAIYR